MKKTKILKSRVFMGKTLDACKLVIYNKFIK